MRRAALILFVVTFFSVIVFAQQQHQKKVFFDTENKKVYWPVEKKFFVKLSESPDSSSPTYLLGSKDSSKGFQLRVSGIHALQWIDTYKGDTSLLNFTADGERPRCRINLKGTKFVSDGKDFYGRGLIALFYANDKYSGVENIYASIDSAKFTIVKDTLSFIDEKQYLVRYYAVDNVGNISNVQAVSFNLDLSAPVTKPFVNGTELLPDMILSKNQILTFKAFDSLSGVKEIWYGFDQNEHLNRVNSPVYLTRLKDGEHTVYFYSVDNVGVAEKQRSIKFSIDNTVPVVNLLFDGDYFSSKNGIDYISKRTVLKVDATDNKSGLEKVEYSVSNGMFSIYQAPFSLSSYSGKVALGIRAVDKKGNVCPVKYFNTVLDVNAPQSKYTVTGPLFKNYNAIFISSKSKIAIDALDDLSGVKDIYYSIGNSNPIKYTEPFSIREDGRCLIKYKAVDNVNNSEDTQNIVVLVDNAPPKIIETFSVANLSEGETKSVKIPLSTSLFLAATDNTTGVSGIWYSFDNKKEQAYVGPIVFDKKGFFNFYVKCMDNLGNTAEKSISVEVVE